MKRYLAFLSLCFYVSFLSGQDHEHRAESKTWALVIGISEYQDNEIKDIKYSALDAQAFAAYLISKAGGILERDHLRILINEEATSGSVNSAIDWLLESARSGDRIIFYYAGYGDSKYGIKKQPAYILPYDFPRSLLCSPGYAFDLYKDYLTYYSEIKDLELLMITDSYIIQDQDKAFSCPDRTLVKVNQEEENPEFMISSPVKPKKSQSYKFQKNTFSHILIDAMTGLADIDRDLKINLQELEFFIKVRTNKSMIRPSGLYMYADEDINPVVHLDSELLRTIQTNEKSTDFPIVKIESGLIYARLLKQATQSAQETYQKFLVAINLGNLLEPEGKSADDYYSQMLTEPSLKKMNNGLKRMFAAALQDEAQQAINAYLENDPKETVNREFNIKSYLKYSKYLGRASELLGDQHFLYDRLKGLEVYFRALSMRLNANVNNLDKSQYKVILEFLKIALELEEEAPYVHNEIGNNYSILNELDTALIYYMKALELAPKWGTPYNNIGVVNSTKKNFDEALIWYQKSIETDPSYSVPYYNMACLYAIKGKKKKALDLLESALEQGFLVKRIILADQDLEHLRTKSRFKKLMSEYFPE